MREALYSVFNTRREQMLKIEDIVRRIVPTLFAAALLIGCGEREPQAAPDAEAAAAAEPAQEAVAEPYRLEQTLYRGGDIVTMAPGGPETAEAVVQREGRIVFVGSEAEAMEMAQPEPTNLMSSIFSSVIFK